MGLSILSGAHMTLVPRVVDLLRAEGADDVVVMVGGTIPREDIRRLKRLGVAEVFTPGAPVQGMIDFIRVPRGRRLVTVVLERRGRGGGAHAGPARSRSTRSPPRCSTS